LIGGNLLMVMATVMVIWHTEMNAKEGNVQDGLASVMTMQGGHKPDSQDFGRCGTTGPSATRVRIVTPASAGPASVRAWDPARWEFLGTRQRSLLRLQSLSVITS
jgi:hypothetical protein